MAFQEPAPAAVRAIQACVRQAARRLTLEAEPARGDGWIQRLPRRWR